ncbi:MORN repeat-containing protein [Desulfopila sp. IMCC35008]|uniref:MORN repeat-containing protein n=1 Tax=Desulfopila sp. IMCC35008 TaxID=2653858 RepID=UPI0013CF7618|nr:hypothetical protein [Desulfopila sp. IMCC35008]
MKYLVILALAVILSSGECHSAGCVSGNYVTGRGTYQWNDGEQYTGDWQNEQKHGYGTYVYSSGEQYSGGWRYNKKHGQGTYVWPGGYQFTGGWQNNLAHGQGIYTYPNGDRSSQVLNMGQLVSEERLSAQSSTPVQATSNTPSVPAVAAPSSLPSGRRWKKAN